MPPPSAAASWPSTSTLPPSDIPLQLALAWLIIRATPPAQQTFLVGPYTKEFVGAVIDIVAREAFEVNPAPGTFAMLKAETDRLIQHEAIVATRAHHKLRAKAREVNPEFLEVAEGASWMDAFPTNFCDVTSGCAFVDIIDQELRRRISEDGEDPNDVHDPLERRSPLGLYFRELLLKIRRLGFDDTALLSAQVAEWCGARPAGGKAVGGVGGGGAADTTTVEQPRLKSVLEQERVADGTLDVRLASINKYQAAADSGDYGAALASLRRFYDYQLPATERPMHQHALLNLATFHYNTGGLESAMEALDGAMRHARRADDKLCLQSCVSLRQRLLTELEAAAWPGSTVPRVSPHPLPPRRLPKSVTPGDELWSIKAAVDMGEPIPIAFRRVYASLGLLHPLTEKPDEEPPQTMGHLNLPAWHAAQAGLWSMMGSEPLADMHEEMALAAPDLDDEARIDVLLARAERIGIQGQFDAALALLLDGDTVDGLRLTDYRRWARVVWTVLEREASLAADGDALAVIAGLRAAPATVTRLGPGGPLRDTFDPETNTSGAASPTAPHGITFAYGQVTTSLHRASKLLASHAPAHLVLPDVLAALQLSASLGLWPLYAAGQLALTDTLLAMGLPAKAEREAAAVWDSLRGVDVATGAFVRAKAAAALALADPNVSDAAGLAAAAGFADVAIREGRKYGDYAVQRDAGALRAMVRELAGLPGGAEAAVGGEEEGTGGEMGKDGEENTPLALPEKSRRVGEIVRLVGVRVAEGWK